MLCGSQAWVHLEVPGVNTWGSSSCSQGGSQPFMVTNCFLIQTEVNADGRYTPLIQEFHWLIPREKFLKFLRHPPEEGLSEGKRVLVRSSCFCLDRTLKFSQENRKWRKYPLFQAEKVSLHRMESSGNKELRMWEAGSSLSLCPQSYLKSKCPQWQHGGSFTTIIVLFLRREKGCITNPLRETPGQYLGKNRKVERNAQRTKVLEEHLCSVGSTPEEVALFFPAQPLGPHPSQGQNWGYLTSKVPSQVLNHPRTLRVVILCARKMH